MKWYVEIVEISTSAVERSIECGSKHLAEMTESGVNINLDHEHYVTRVVNK
uniref:hypothetical protein n=1 Tax=Burkholderia sp. M701 TaxID=326454 RepID=UPI0012EB52B2|nr:hypothetical protein [Burkholderia sp. M701]